MSQTEKNINRDDVICKLAIVNKIIRKGYENAVNEIRSNNYREFYLSIKNNNYFQIREQLMSELYPLVCSR